jgi:hypothetical protein
MLSLETSACLASESAEESYVPPARGALIAAKAAPILASCTKVPGEKSMRRISGPVVAILVTLTAAQTLAGNIQMPRLFDPPPPRAQIADAQIWDPYPLPGVGTPTDSTRPRGFFDPPPEATRGRYPNPGTFPRSAPWLRSSAPVDYPNIRKRLPSSRRTAPVVQAPATPEVVQPAE